MMPDTSYVYMLMIMITLSKNVAIAFKNTVILDTS